MNFKRAPGKAPPVIKQRVIQVPKGTSGPTNITASSKPRSVTKEPGRIAPASITKTTRSPPLPVRDALAPKLLDLYFQHQIDSHSCAQRAREQGVSLQDIEPFDLTSLYGAREDAVEQLHARNAPFGSQYPFSPLRLHGDTPLFDDDDDDGEMFGWAAEQVNPPPAPQVENSPAPPPPPPPPPPSRLLASLPLPRGTTPAAAAAPGAVVAPARKTVNRPPAPPGPPTNAVYAVGSRPVPPAVQAVVDEVLLRAEKKSNKAGFPQRVDLRNMPSGMKDLDRRYGYISAGSGLMGFYGDLRLFNEATWKYLVSSGKAE